MHQFTNKAPTDIGERLCTINRSNSFAFASLRSENTNSWCDWPKKKEVTFPDAKTIKIDTGFCTLTYTFIEA